MPQHQPPWPWTRGAAHGGRQHLAGPRLQAGSDLAMAAPFWRCAHGSHVPSRRLQSVFNLTLQMFNGRRVFMILNYYCFEVNGLLSHVRPYMLCGESAKLSPGPACHIPWEARPAPSQCQPGDHEVDSATNCSSRLFFFFFKGNVCYLESYLKYTYSKKQSPWLSVFLQPGCPGLHGGAMHRVGWSFWQPGA